MVLKSIHCTFFLDTNARRVNHINICTSPLNHALSRAIKMAQSSIAQSPNPNTALGLLSTFSTTYTRSPMWWPEKRFKGKNKRSHATSLQILVGDRKGNGEEYPKRNLCKLKIVTQLGKVHSI